MGSLAVIVHAQIWQQNDGIDRVKTFPHLQCYTYNVTLTMLHLRCYTFHLPCNRAKVRRNLAKVNQMEIWAGVKVARNPDWRRWGDIEHAWKCSHTCDVKSINQGKHWMEIWIDGNLTSSALCENFKSLWLNGMQYLHQATLTFSIEITQKRKPAMESKKKV